MKDTAIFLRARQNEKREIYGKCVFFWMGAVEAFSRNIAILLVFPWRQTEFEYRETITLRYCFDGIEMVECNLQNPTGDQGKRNASRG